MSDAEEATVSMCWECEAQTDQLITVGFPTSPHHVTTLTLCPDCYRDCYLPAVSDLAAHLDNSEPGQSGRAPDVRRHRLTRLLSHPIPHDESPQWKL